MQLFLSILMVVFFVLGFQGHDIAVNDNDRKTAWLLIVTGWMLLVAIVAVTIGGHHAG